MVKQRVPWVERDHRGWEVSATPIGGRLRGFRADSAARQLHPALTQAWIAHNLGPVVDDPDIAYCATICTKVIQRGLAPYLSPEAEAALIRLGVPLECSSEQYNAAICGPDRLIKLDDNIELHPTWEQPFWDLLPAELRRFVHPQVKLEMLVAADRKLSHF